MIIRTMSQWRWRMPGLRRPWISGMYGLKSSIACLISWATSITPATAKHTTTKSTHPLCVSRPLALHAANNTQHIRLPYEMIVERARKCWRKPDWSATQNQQLESGKTKKWKVKQRICSEVSVNSPRGISEEEEKEGYGGKDLQKRKVLSVEWKMTGWWMMRVVSRWNWWREQNVNCRSVSDRRV